MICAMAAQVRVHGFSEGDQETLYEAAQKAKGTGRRGLGVGDALKLAKSARWAGTRRRSNPPCLLPGLWLTCCNVG